jgi:hypothetical protein
MLRNAIIHIANEQPFMADLLDEPGPNDVSLVCRNVRMMNGKKPVFVDLADSTFVMPISHVRFIEIPAKAYADDGEADVDRPPVSSIARGRRKRAAPEATEAADDAGAARAALRRMGAFEEDGTEPAPETEPVPEVNGDGLDVDLLRRIHEA